MEWISTLKQMPDANVEVLVIEEYTNDIHIAKLDMDYSGGGYFKAKGLVRNSDYIFNGEDEVYTETCEDLYFMASHWTPLPKLT